MEAVSLQKCRLSMVYRISIGVFLAVYLMGQAFGQVKPTPRSQEGTTSGGLPLINYEAFGKKDFSKLPVEDGGKIVARVNGLPVTLDQFDTEMKWSIGPSAKVDPARAEGLKTALTIPVMDNIILNEVLDQYAKKYRLEPAEAEIQNEIKRRNAELTSGNKLEDRASVCSLPTTSVVELVRSDIIRLNVQRFLADQATSTSLNTEEYAKFLKASEAMTTNTETYRASHIVFRATPDMSPYSIEDNRIKAEEVLAKIGNGEDFGTAARTYSQDRFTIYLKGDMGYFTAGTMYPEFENALKQMKVGDISSIVRTPVGFHIIKLTEKYPTNGPLLYQQFQRKIAADEGIKRLVKNAKIEKYL